MAVQQPHNLPLGKQRHSLMLVLLNGGTRRALMKSAILAAPLADACVTEWRSSSAGSNLPSTLAPLADACVTEWRFPPFSFPVFGSLRHSLMLVLLNGGVAHHPRPQQLKRHSLMLVLLNGGSQSTRGRPGWWRHSLMLVLLNGGDTSESPLQRSAAPLADACVTEWRLNILAYIPALTPRHSLMLVLLNGGGQRSSGSWNRDSRHSLMLVLLNGGANKNANRRPSSSRHSLMLVLLNSGW